jgi:N-acetylglucosaminyldiphosphoundecaprenol N-acetyl-beta-D-mannosaminyltransferase
MPSEPATARQGSDREPAAAAPRRRVRIGSVWIDAVTFAEALDRIAELVAQGRGGSVFTPNVDHVVNADREEPFRAAYRSCSLSLVDGQPVYWASRLLGTRLPQKVSGSDLLDPLMERAAREKWRVYLLGASPDVAEKAAEILRGRGVEIVGADPARLTVAADPALDEPVIARVNAARPHLVLAALGSPKQELWVHRCGEQIRPAVYLGIGASLDFLTGKVKRAPRWMQAASLEWLYRLLSEPRRLAYRYLVNDPRFLFILLRTLFEPRRERVQLAAGPADTLKP